MKNILVKILSLTLGVIGAIVLNYYFIENLIIPDPCYYHTRDAGFLFALFYDKPAANGGHPFPTLVNFIMTICTGLVLGLTVYKFYSLRRRYHRNVDKRITK